MINPISLMHSRIAPIRKVVRRQNSKDNKEHAKNDNETTQNKQKKPEILNKNIGTNTIDVVL